MQVKTSLKAGLVSVNVPAQAMEFARATADTVAQSVQTAAQAVQNTAQSAAQVLTNPKTYTWPF